MIFFSTNKNAPIRAHINRENSLFWRLVEMYGWTFNQVNEQIDIANYLHISIGIVK